jgi:hypothetical protein
MHWWWVLRLPCMVKVKVNEARCCFCGCGQPYGLPSISKYFLYLSLSLSIFFKDSRQYYTYRLLSLTTDRRWVKGCHV